MAQHCQKIEQEKPDKDPKPEYDYPLYEVIYKGP